MSHRENYRPGRASGARVDKQGDAWTLVLVRDLRHPPALVWDALTDPAQLKEWAPFDADRNLAAPGAVTLTTVGAPQPNVAKCEVVRTEKPRLLEYTWGGNDLRWELEAQGEGTRLTLWTHIPKGFIAWGAAGWHVCLDVLDRHLLGDPVGRLVGADALQHEGWKRLTAEYGKQLGLEP